MTPAALGEIMASGHREGVDRVTQAFLPMKKPDAAKIEAPAHGGG